MEQKDLHEGNLKVTSAVRADKVYTLSKGIIRKKFGKVNTEVLNSVRTKIEYLIK
ncbi:type II toxin-antitoxin system PemK/MazF family toxin [Anaerobacillus isosaccharinicus]|uniref:Type II toxin-antitoxin system PemK/MazF family toxin n=1 Tax=Anaerobacillus isosaccharinicus TaxID=1532552 RepID=A0AC62A479_9BACI